MGIIKQGILGGFSGKVANVVGSSWKGIAVMKSLPLSVANPRTSLQVAQRSAFALTIALASVILSDWVKPLWDRFAQQMSGFNAFSGENIEKISLDPGETYENFVMSKGKMSEVALSNIVADAASNQIDFDWNADSGGNYALATDVMFAIGFGNDLSTILKGGSPKSRASASASLYHPGDMLVGEKYFFAVAFRRADGTIVTDSTIQTIVAT